MTKQPEDLVVRISRDIQRTLAEHTKKFAVVDRRFDEIEQRLDDVNDGVVAALGLVSRADIRYEAVDKRLKELETVVARLGSKR
jgi:tetrahydromethanopterin S-methyltransferase subunit G